MAIGATKINNLREIPNQAHWAVIIQGSDIGCNPGLLHYWVCDTENDAKEIIKSTFAYDHTEYDRVRILKVEKVPTFFIETTIKLVY